MRYFWLRPIALGRPELPRHQAGASAAATRGAYLTRSRLKVDDFGDFTVGWRARRYDRSLLKVGDSRGFTVGWRTPRAEMTAPC